MYKHNVFGMFYFRENDTESNDPSELMAESSSQTENLFDKILQMDNEEEIIEELIKTISRVKNFIRSEYLESYLKGILANSASGINLIWEIFFEKIKKSYRVSVIMNISGNRATIVCITNDMPRTEKFYRLKIIHHIVRRTFHK